LPQVRKPNVLVHFTRASQPPLAKSHSLISDSELVWVAVKDKQDWLDNLPWQAVAPVPVKPTGQGEHRRDPTVLVQLTR
jgi:hypothetical protein